MSINKLFPGATASVAAVLLVAACSGPESPIVAEAPEPPAIEAPEIVAPRPDVYADFSLVSDLAGLTDNQRKMLVLLIEASQVMDDLFWRQAYGDDYQQWLASIGVDEVRRFAELNYGPWDRLNDEAPFMEGVGPKPLGARFYPADMTKEEFEAAELPGKDSLYTFVRRDEDGELA